MGGEFVNALPADWMGQHMHVSIRRPGSADCFWWAARPDERLIGNSLHYLRSKSLEHICRKLHRRKTCMFSMGWSSIVSVVKCHSYAAQHCIKAAGLVIKNNWLSLGPQDVVSPTIIPHTQGIGISKISKTWRDKMCEDRGERDKRGEMRLVMENHHQQHPPTFFNSALAHEDRAHPGSMAWSCMTHFPATFTTKSLSSMLTVNR